MSLNGAISDHATGEYTVSRRAAGHYEKGKWVDVGDPTTFTIVASVQPETEDLLDLPEGQSVDSVKVFFTETYLHSRVAEEEPDELVIDGANYYIWSAKKWDHWGETHYVVTAIKTDVP